MNPLSVEGAAEIDEDQVTLFPALEALRGRGIPCRLVFFPLP
jgi:hypothetical protein